jgi:hypothetical protein
MQTRAELVLELQNLIIKQLNLQEVKPESFDENTPLFGEGLGLDSIDALRDQTLRSERSPQDLSKCSNGCRLH